MTNKTNVQTQQAQEEQKRARLWWRFESGTEKIKFLTAQLRDLGLQELGFEAEGRKLMAYQCDALKGILAEMDQLDKQLHP